MASLMRVWALCAAWLLMAGTAAAEKPVEAYQKAEVERLRGEVADQIQLYTYELVDELVYGWTEAPVFDKPTPVVVADVTVPVGLGTGLQALVETHLASTLSENPTTNVQLVHCPACTAVVTHSGPEGTVVSRGVDNPKVLEELGAGGTGKFALFLDIEAEGSWLVLRARLTRLDPDLPIVWSRTISASSTRPALLRAGTDLKSAEDARKEYMDALTGKYPFQIPLRMGVRTYAQPFDNTQVGAPPFLWISTGIELAPTHARTWTSSITVGGSHIPQAYTGLMAEARVSRLVGKTRSLTRPNLYGFVGGGVQTVWGPATAAFRNETLTADQVLAGAAAEGPRTAFGVVNFGADVRFGNRVGLTGYFEAIPQYNLSPNFGVYVNVFGLYFPAFGTEVTLWF